MMKRAEERVVSDSQVTSPATSVKPRLSETPCLTGGAEGWREIPNVTLSLLPPTINTLNKLVSSHMGHAALSANIAIALV